MKPKEFTLHFVNGEWEDVVLLCMEENYFLAIVPDSGKKYKVCDSGKVILAEEVVFSYVGTLREADVQLLKEYRKTGYLGCDNKEEVCEKIYSFLEYDTTLDETGKCILVPKQVFKCTGYLRNPKKVADWAKSNLDLHKCTEEYVYLLVMDSKCAPVGIFELAHGTVNQALFSSREIFLKVLLVNGVAILLLHNHPSGDSTPSREDITATRKVMEGAELLNLSLIDSVIIGKDGFYSCREDGILRRGCSV